MKKIYKVKICLELLVYDEIDEQDPENCAAINMALKQAAREYPYGTKNNVKVSEVKTLKQIPQDWSMGDIPFGRRNQKSLKDIYSSKDI